MPSERVQRRIDSLLDQADEAVADHDWVTVKARAESVLAFDPSNEDALEYIQASGRASAEQNSQTAEVVAPGVQLETPSSFAEGRYTVKRLLGEGGKKKVYLAHDELLDRDVAFALIKTEGLDEVSRARISREAQAMGRLGSHPHIVTVFDLGEVDSSHADPLGGASIKQPFMVTELMGGGDVEGLIEKADDHRLPLEQAIKIARETCRGMEFAHGRDIVHRDLKPGNVWLTEDGIAKIGDF